MNLDDALASRAAALTVTDVSSLLDVDTRTVSRACEDGQLPSLRIGRRLLIPRLPLLALLGADGQLPELEPAASATGPPGPVRLVTGL